MSDELVQAERHPLTTRTKAKVAALAIVCAVLIYFVADFLLSDPRCTAVHRAGGGGGAELCRSHRGVRDYGFASAGGRPSNRAG